VVSSESSEEEKEEEEPSDEPVVLMSRSGRLKNPPKPAATRVILEVDQLEKTTNFAVRSVCAFMFNGQDEPRSFLARSS
jgi:hypothetical protein